MVGSKSGDRSYQAAMKNALAIASFMIAIPGASFAKNSTIETALGAKSKGGFSSEAASVDAISGKKNSKTKNFANENDDEKFEKPKSAKKPSVKKHADQKLEKGNAPKSEKKNEKTADKSDEPKAKIFDKPFYTKVGLNGDEFERISEKQMAIELGLNYSDKYSAKANNQDQKKSPWQKIGAPYKVNGLWYIPAAQTDYDETGVASWYGPQFHGKKTANGEIFDMNEVSIAHPTLPIPCLVEVTNLDNGRSIIARVNDRGPFANDRLIDVSAKAADLLGFKAKGTANVRVKYIGMAPNDVQNDNSQATAPVETKPILKNQKIVEKESDSIKLVKNVKVEPPKGNVKSTQIGAFTDLKLAKKFAAEKGDGKNTNIVEAMVGDKLFYRVFLNEAAPQENAQKAKAPSHNSILASL